MGQTLTHGVYLPDEGERNCYNGLAANWSILDNSVGTIAEHSTQIAGKAPLVHTHTKSDVTDLFNSANTWTGDNTFNGSNSFNSGLTINNAALLNAVLQNAVKGDVSTTGDFAIFVKDKVNGNAATSLLAVYRGGQDSGGSYAQINIDTKGNDNNRYNNSILFRINPADNSNNAVLIPQRDKTIDLGTSTNEWNNLYAKNYYYNGTAWGLDKENTWTQNQVIASSNDKCYFVKDTVYELGQSYSNGEHLGGLTIHDKNGSSVGLLDIVDRSYGYTEMRIRVQQKFDPNSNNRSTSGTIIFNELIIGIASDKTNYISFNADLWGANHNLGTSTNKWKTLNGINPGALSLPNLSRKSSILEYITDLTGGLQYYTPLANGWICIQADNSSATNYIRCAYDDILVKANGNGQAQGLSVLIPVLAGVQIGIRVVCTTLSSAYFYHCQGNVT